jgi:CRISPR-associated endoribonuclease Cas6
MQNSYLYSLVLELVATSSVSIPTWRGDQTHALFLHLVEAIDPALSRRLHSEDGYRPFTVSRLGSPESERKTLSALHSGQTYRLRITLLDGGPLWQRLSTHFLETEKLELHLDKASFQLTRVLSSPGADPSGWASYTDWQTLAGTPVRSSLTLHFASPCAFSLGDRQFGLFPEPKFVWDSLARTWNLYAPPVLRIDKRALREFVTQHVAVSDYKLCISRVAYTEVIQKGFLGTCTYEVKIDQPCAHQVAALAAIAIYAGIGSKTTRGMGQARMLEASQPAPLEAHNA